MKGKQNIIQFFMAMVLDAGLLAPAALSVKRVDATGRIQPLLAQMALEIRLLG